MKSRWSTLASLAVLAAVLGPLPCAADEYPSRPIRIIVPYPPGATTDLTARAVAEKLRQSLGQPVVVDNRGGASGAIGSEAAARSEPDGYTIVLGTNASHVLNVFLTRRLPYDPVKDFTPIAAAVQNIICLAVHPSVPATTVSELLAHARKNPGKLSFGSSGTGSPHHLAGELLKQLAKVDLVHVPYRGGGPAVSDLLGGQIPMVFASLATVVPHMKAGRVRVLAVVERTRYVALPDVPTIGETVKGFEMSSWLAFFGPAGVPKPIVTKLNAEIVKALRAEDVRSKLEPAGLAVLASTPEELGAMVRHDLDRWSQVVRAAGIQPE